MTCPLPNVAYRSSWLASPPTVFRSCRMLKGLTPIRDSINQTKLTTWHSTIKHQTSKPVKLYGLALMSLRVKVRQTLTLSGGIMTGCLLLSWQMFTLPGKDGSVPVIVTTATVRRSVYLSLPDALPALCPSGWGAVPYAFVNQQCPPVCRLPGCPPCPNSMGPW